MEFQEYIHGLILRNNPDEALIADWLNAYMVSLGVRPGALLDTNLTESELRSVFPNLYLRSKFIATRPFNPPMTPTERGTFLGYLRPWQEHESVSQFITFYVVLPKDAGRAEIFHQELDILSTTTQELMTLYHKISGVLALIEVRTEMAIYESLKTELRSATFKREVDQRLMLKLKASVEFLLMAYLINVGLAQTRSFSNVSGQDIRLITKNFPQLRMSRIGGLAGDLVIENVYNPSKTPDIPFTISPRALLLTLSASDLTRAQEALNLILA
jgi:hypothetical protein